MNFLIDKIVHLIYMSVETISRFSMMHILAKSDLSYASVKHAKHPSKTSAIWGQQ